MTELELALRQQQLGRQQQQQDIDNVNRGLGGVMGALTAGSERGLANAEKQRQVASPIQKFLNMALSGRMAPRQAARAYQLAKNGKIPEDAFDYDPETPGIQSTPPIDMQGGFQGGAPPGMAGAPGMAPGGLGTPPVQGPVNQQYTPQAQGGLAAPVQQAPQQMPQYELPPEPVMSEHQWNMQNISDLGAATEALGKHASPGRDHMGELLLRMQSQKELQDERLVATSEEKGKDRGAADARAKARNAIADRALTQAAEQSEKNRVAAMERVLASTRQSDINNLRTNETSADIKLRDQYNRELANLRNIDAKLRTSQNALFDNPEVLEALGPLQEELEKSAAEVERLGLQIQQRLKMRPTDKSTSSTAVKTSPSKTAKATADDFLKRRKPKSD